MFNILKNIFIKENPFYTIQGEISDPDMNCLVFTEDAMEINSTASTVLENHQRNIEQLYDDIMGIQTGSEPMMAVVVACAIVLSLYANKNANEVFTKNFIEFIIDAENQLRLEGKYQEVVNLIDGIINKCQGYIYGIVLITVGSIIIQDLVEFFKYIDNDSNK